MGKGGWLYHALIEINDIKSQEARRVETEDFEPIIIGEYRHGHMFGHETVWNKLNFRVFKLQDFKFLPED